MRGRGGMQRGGDAAAMATYTVRHEKCIEASHQFQCGGDF